MAKQLLHYYTFDPTTNTVVIEGIFARERFLLITNSAIEQQLYVFNDGYTGFASVTFDYAAETTTLVLDYDCSGMSASDKLQIFIEQDYQTFEPSPTYADPVSKFRVSQPENLIDTDFEYGLQSTKWETLELTKNIPTFYNRNGDQEIDLVDVFTSEQSNVVTVTTASGHNLQRGAPIIMVGTSTSTADGGFLVASVPDANTFTYVCKAVQLVTTSIKESYTQLFPGSVYSGTEFKLSAVDGILTNAADPSTLTVATEYPTNFSNGTSMVLANTFARSTITFDTDNVVPDNFQTIVKSYTSATATGENSDFTLGGVHSINFQPYNNAYYFEEGSLTIDTTSNQIVFPTPHGFTSLNAITYICDTTTNTPIPNIDVLKMYWVGYVDEYRITLQTTRSTAGTTTLNLTGNGVSGGVIKSAFAFLIGGGITSQTGSTSDYFNFYATHGLPTTPRRRFLALPVNGGTHTNVLTRTSDVFQPRDTAYDYWSIRINTTQSRAGTTSTGGTVTTVGTSSLDMAWLLIQDSAPVNANTLYFANHGLNEFDVVTLTATAGTLPGGLVSGNNYRVTPVGPDRLSFRDPATGSTVLFESSGSTDLAYSITAVQQLPNNDTITIPNLQLSDGDAITYDVNAGTSLGGLTDGTTYYVARKSGDTFNLSTNQNVLINVISVPDQASATYVSIANNYIQGITHGMTTGDAFEYVSSSPIIGLRSGSVYFARAIDATTISIHPTAADAVANTNQIIIYAYGSGTGTLNHLSLVDITSAPTGEIQKFASDFVGAADGIYSVQSTAANGQSFTLQAAAQIQPRTVARTCQASFVAPFNAFYYPDHGLRTGTPFLYTAGTPNNITGLTSGQTYNVIRLNKDFIAFAVSEYEANQGNAIALSDSAVSVSQDGLLTFENAGVVGSFLGLGTVSFTSNSLFIDGTDTAFTSYFNAGDTFSINIPQTVVTKTVSSVTAASDYFTATAHGLVNGSIITFSATLAPTNIALDTIYYANTSTTGSALDRFKVCYSYADAIAGTNFIDLVDVGTDLSVNHIQDNGSVISRTIEHVNSDNRLTVTEPLPATAQTNVGFFLSTSLLLRSDGFALHRAYDGGVELIPSSNPDSQMIRQTRKYFRYQSGKGIQVSYAINFSPTSGIDLFSRVGTTGTIRTRFPHRLTAGLSVVTSGATNVVDNNVWNGTLLVSAIVDDLTFEVTLPSTPTDSQALGIVEYYVQAWAASALRCGLHDDQNGLFFEFDGSVLHACRRSSTLQLSGYAATQFRSAEVLGTDSRWSSQLSVGDYVVIKGQSYVVTRIESDTKMYISPSYRGVTADKIIVTKTVDLKVPQNEWNIDVCDGTGPSGFVLDIHKIQMAYMDYSWYGAGKVRFGFKDQYGIVRYVHEFIHNNRQTEAYMRSGNLPARYEIQNYGTPTYVPALAHWGTSVIMDGRFDPDKAYAFNATSNNITFTGQPTISFSGKVEYTGIYTQRVGSRNYNIGYAVVVDSPDANLSTIPAGALISTGANLAATTSTDLPSDSRVTPYQPYLPSITTREGTDFATQAVRTLMVVDKQPTGTAGTSSNYTITLPGGGNVDYSVPIPLISIRLAPSVDTGTPGFLGEREIINRMQLILQQVGILSTHATEVRLILNGQLSTNAWSRVTNPSLSQLLLHSTEDSISGGSTIYSFRASGGTGTADRTQVLTFQDLGEVATLGNSIMGGDNVFPDGPDVLTIAVVLTEDPSTVSGTNPFVVSGRISWSESQA